MQANFSLDCILVYNRGIMWKSAFPVFVSGADIRSCRHDILLHLLIAQHKKRTTDIAMICCPLFMPLAGLEPARGEPLDFESSASANSATAA